MLDALELTGRSRGHVVELDLPRCTLHRDVVLPFLALRGAALADGIDLVPASSFRDFERQRSIWNANHRHNERTVKVIIAQLTGSLSHQRTSMTGSAMEPAFLHTLARRVLSADWIV